MSDISNFDSAIQAKDAKKAVALWNQQFVIDGNVPEMVVAALIRLQSEIDWLRDELASKQ